jgi:adenylate kinase
MKLILLGAPGAGKGTQAAVLSRRLGIPAISTGDILRAAIRQGTEVGLQAKKFIDNGQLVPDEVILGIVRERLAQPDCAQGFILDGFPRTIPQAEALEAEGVEIDEVLSIEADDQLIIERMSGRRTCSDCGASYHVASKRPAHEGKCDVCGGKLTIRDDDKPETVKARLEVFHRETEPLKTFYASRGKLVAVDTQPEVEQTTAAIFRALRIEL